MSRSLQRGASKSEGRPTGMGLSSDVSTRRSLSEMGVARVCDAPTECPTEAGSVKPGLRVRSAPQRGKHLAAEEVDGAHGIGREAHREHELSRASRFRPASLLETVLRRPCDGQARAEI